MAGGAFSLSPITSFFAEQRWHGSYQTMSYFATNTTSFHSCGSAILDVPNVTMSFGPPGDRVALNVTMPLSVGEFPGASPSFVTQVFAGRFDVVIAQKFPSARDADFEYTAALAPVEVDEANVKHRANLMCIKLALQSIGGGYRALRYVERGGVSSGQFGWSSCPSVSSDVECSSSRQFNVMRLFPRASAWHASPWSACSGSSSNQTREVQCRDEYGVRMGDAHCLAAAAKPVSWRPCEAVSVPAAREGRFVALLHAVTALTNLTKPTPDAVVLGLGRQGLVMANLTVSAADAAMLAAAAADAGVSAPAAPGMVFSVDDVLFFDQARDAVAESAFETPPGVLDVSVLPASAYSASSSLGFPRYAAAATLTGASATLLQGFNASSSPMALATEDGGLPSGRSAAAGLSAGASGFAVAWTPELPSSAAAFGASGRGSRALTPSDADAARRLSPATSVLAGIATRAPVAYQVQPFGTCLYDGAQNRCERRRPTPRCLNGDSEAVDAAFCARLRPPVVDTETPCAGCRRWKITAWSSCSAVCGGGARSRDVTCVDSANATVSDSHCVALLGPKPTQGEACNPQSCAEFRIGSWSACSRACGDGQQTRPVTCVDNTGPVPAPRCAAESVLFPAGPPNATRRCNNCPCQDATRLFQPRVRVPPSLAASPARPGLNVSAAGRWSPLLASAFCPAGFRLLRLSEWRCFPAAAQTAMCSDLNSAAAPRVLPFAFQAEAGAAGVLPRSLPRPTGGSAAPDVIRVRPDASCLFLDFDFRGSAFADVTRQSAVGACRAVA